MEVVIKGVQQDLRVSTVTLQPESGSNMYAFHCSSCGKFLQQVGGKVSKIYPFYEPSKDVPVIQTCSQCSHKYTFQTHDGYVSDKVRVILHPTDDTNFFYCAEHKYRILQYSPVEVFTLSDGRKHAVPFSASCNQDNCNRTYFFAEII